MHSLQVAGVEKVAGTAGGARMQLKNLDAARSLS